jgi:hypothetical protein
MAVITAQLTTFDTNNYVGELFRVGKRPVSFLKLMGGIAGGVKVIRSARFPLAVTLDLANTPGQPAVLEGADAPTVREVTTAQTDNLVQIFHEAVELSYSVQAQQDEIDGIAVIPGSQGGLITDPTDPAFQIVMALEKIQDDMNYSFLRGTYQNPGDNSTARKTRGITNADNIGTVTDSGVTLAFKHVEQALREMVDAGAHDMGVNLMVFADATRIQELVDDLEDTLGKEPESRTVVGFEIAMALSFWGRFGLVYEKDMVADNALVADMSLVAPVARMIPKRGLLFSEPLAKTGSADKEQIYGEWGVAYGYGDRHVLIDVS